MRNQTETLVDFARSFPIVPARPSKRLSWKWIVLIAAIMGSIAVAAFSLRPGRSVADEARLPNAAKAHEVQLGSRVGGRVAAVHVQQGQLVELGQVLVTFEAQELIARRDQAQSRLAAAQAALERAVDGPLPEEIAEAKAAADAARARLERAGAGPRQEQKRRDRAELDAALAVQTHADADFARAERLMSHAAVAQAEYDTALAARDQARHRVTAAEATLDQLLHGSRSEEIAEVQAEFNRVQAHYELLRRGTRSEDRAAAAAAVALAKAQLAEAEATLRETVVITAERCVIVQVKVRPGSVVAAGESVIVAH